MKSKLEQTGHVGILTFDGELSNEREAELVMLLMRAFHNSDFVVLNLTNVERIDRTCRQVLLSIYHKARRTNKSLKLIGASTDAFDLTAEGIDMCSN